MSTAHGRSELKIQPGWPTIRKFKESVRKPAINAREEMPLKIN